MNPPEIREIIQFCDEGEILGQADQLPVCSSVLMCFPANSNSCYKIYVQYIARGGYCCFKIINL